MSMCEWMIEHEGRDIGREDMKVTREKHSVETEKEEGENDRG